MCAKIPEIRALRKAIWSHIPNRDHSPVQIYTYGDDQYDMMVFGEVSYDHHHPGHQTATEWAARFKLAKEGGEIKVRVCHVIVVCSFLGVGGFGAVADVL